MSWKSFFSTPLSTCLLSGVLVSTVFGLSLFGTTTVKAQSSTISSDSLKVRILQKRYNYNSTTRRWELDTTTSTNTYEEKLCKDLYNQKVLGISDHQDGISLNVKRLITKREYTPKYPAENGHLYYLGGIERAEGNLRNCTKYNLLAGNIDSALYQDAEVGFPKHSKDVEAFYYRPTGALPPEEKLKSFVSANLPIYTYHFQFTYKFPEEQKTQLSSLYRKQTGAEEGETYDGVVWTYTYYTYLDKQTNQYKPWTNPNIDNENGGFLIYKYQIEDKPLCLDSCPVQDKDTIMGYYKPTYAPDDVVNISYNLKDKKLRFQGDVPVGSSGCWSLGNQHQFIVKPHSNGQYGIFKLAYQVKYKNADMCTTEMKIQFLDYTQDMSSLSKEAEEFLIKTLKENKFTESDVESYEGSLPPVY